MKYKVGDKAKVKEKLTVGRTYGHGVCFVSGMKECLGKIVTIKKCVGMSYEVEESDWYFSDKMLEPITETEAPTWQKT